MNRSGPWPYLWMLAGCFSFAWMAEFTHLLTAGDHDWRVIALSRSAFMVVAAALLALSSGVPLVFARPPALWVRSLAGSVSVVCNFYAFSRLSPPEALTLSKTFPIWVAFLSWPLLRQRPTAAVWLGAFCGVAGVALIQLPYLATGAGLTANAGVPVGLFSAFCSAVAMLGLNRLQGIGTAAIVVHFAVTATVLTGVVALVPPAPRWPAGPALPAVLLLLGVSTAALAGQLCLTRAFSTGPAASVSVVALTQVLFSLALGLVFRPREFHPATLAGIALVLAPTAWVIASRTQRAAR